MAGQVDSTPYEGQPSLGFTVAHQKVDLELDLCARKLKGKTEITVNPLTPDLKVLRFDCRQAKIQQVKFGNRVQSLSSVKYIDPYSRLRLPFQSSVHHHDNLTERLKNQLSYPKQPELEIPIPKHVKINELDSTIVVDKSGRPTADPAAADLGQNTKNASDRGPRYSPVIVQIEYVIEHIRDGVQFVGWDPEELQYPHAYTQSLSGPAVCCLFPCVDNIESKHTWEVSIKTAKTIGDAFRLGWGAAGGGGLLNGYQSDQDWGEKAATFSNEDKALDLAVICSGDMTDEVGEVFLSCLFSRLTILDCRSS